MNQNREMIAQYASNSNVVDISCTDCTWRQNKQLASGRTTQQEELAIFDSHDCKDFPRCDAPGCNNKATDGFQPFVDAGFSQNPTAKILGNETWWCKKHESLGYEFSGTKGNALTSHD
jgi:hypothetical protein